MSQIRIKALKGEGKTTSRKAIKSGRASSGTASPASHDALSRVFNPEEAGNHSEIEDTPPQTPGEIDLDALQSGEHRGDDDEPLATFDPKTLISELEDRKFSQHETRELLLQHYVRLLQTRYNDDLERVDTKELAEAFIKSARSGTTPKERRLALQAYSLSITLSDLSKAEAARAALKSILVDDKDEEVKIHALYALTLSIVHYGGGDDDIADYLDFLIEAIQNNGEHINAIGMDRVIVALFVSWAYAATQVESIWAQADYTMDAFVDKLDSTHVDTQTAAAECIAYIFEQSRIHERDEGEPFELPYDPARVASRIHEIQGESTRGMSKKDRSSLRDSLRSVVTSLEAGVGPYYSTSKNARNVDHGYRYKFHKTTSRYDDSAPMRYVASVETWHHLHRIAFLRNVYGSGLEKHLGNETPFTSEVLDGLDWSMFLRTDTRSGGGPGFQYDDLE